MYAPFPQQKHVGEGLFLIDDVTNGGDVFSSAVYSCDSKESRFDNFKTKQMLTLNILN